MQKVNDFRVVKGVGQQRTDTQMECTGVNFKGCISQLLVITFH